MNNGTAKGLWVAAGALLITISTTVFLGGSRLGKTEEAVAAARDRIAAVELRQALQEVVLDDIRERQARQEGKVDAKLEGLEKGQKAIIEKLDGG
jgi:uncharacterized coiled-coil protein SlyX